MGSQVFLSILIPVYNWDIALLLKTLHKQCASLQNPEEFEIVVADDGSSRSFANSSVAAGLTGVVYKELGQNRGRSGARNFLIDLARGEYVLFLDADMLPDQESFVQTYYNLAKAGEQVVCGGISYLQYEEQSDHTGFYVYKSRKTEALSAAERNRMPWRYVFTSNIMLRRDILDSVRFDQDFTAYGFEDVEWALRLSESFQIKHIDNTCSHMGVMDKQQVFARMREASNNHYLMFTRHPEKIGTAGAVGLAKYLQHLPGKLLSFCDRFLAFLFSHTSWNWFLYLVLQCDKAVLLAQRMKESRRET